MDINVDSEDYLQDVAFDYYNEIMAVCSIDRKIRIYKKGIINKNDNEDLKSREKINEIVKNHSINIQREDENYIWKQTYVFDAYDFSVRRILFSSPEFGPILASCGYDKFVRLWKEKVDENDKLIWKLESCKIEFNDYVEDISFCHKIFGLKLAGCSKNGKIKIIDIINTNVATNKCTFQKDSPLSCSSICWNPSPFDPPSFVVGCYSSDHVKLSDKDLNKERELDLSINIDKFNNKNNKEELKDLIQIYVYNQSTKEYVLFHLITDTLNNHSNSVTYLEWAPQYGRSYHMISTCSLDNYVKIWKFDLEYDSKQSNVKIENISQMMNFNNGCSIYRISFNQNGTILCSNDNNGKIRLFKKQEYKFLEVL